MKVIVLAVAALLCTSCASRESVEVPHDRLAAAAGEQHGFEPPEAFLMFHASGVGWLERHPTGGLAFAVWEDGQLVRAAGLDDPGEYSCARGYISPQDHAKLIEAVRNALLRVPEDSCLPFDSNGYVLTYLGARNCVERYEWIGNNGEPLGSWGEPLQFGGHHTHFAAAFFFRPGLPGRSTRRSSFSRRFTKRSPPAGRPVAS